MRTMYDSVTPADIPTGAELVAGYINGRYRWSPPEWARWAAAKCVYITVTAAYDVALVLDVEAGNAVPTDAPSWVQRAGPATGWVPTLYGTRATLEQCSRLMPKSVRYSTWLADWTGHEHLPAGYDLCQWAAPGYGSPGHYDLSAVADDWPRKL